MSARLGTPRDTAATKAKVFGTDLLDVRISLWIAWGSRRGDAPLYIKALMRNRRASMPTGRQLTPPWCRPRYCREGEGYCHAKLSAVRIAGEVKHGPADSADVAAMRRASSRVSASKRTPSRRNRLVPEVLQFRFWAEQGGSGGGSRPVTPKLSNSTAHAPAEANIAFV